MVNSKNHEQFVLCQNSKKLLLHFKKICYNLLLINFQVSIDLLCFWGLLYLFMFNFVAIYMRKGGNYNLRVGIKKVDGGKMEGIFEKVFLNIFPI